MDSAPVTSDDSPAPLRLGSGMAHRARRQSVVRRTGSPHAYVGAVARSSLGFGLAVGRAGAIRPVVRAEDLNSFSLRPPGRPRRHAVEDVPIGVTASSTGSPVGRGARTRATASSARRPSWTEQVLQRSLQQPPSSRLPAPESERPAEFVSTGNARLDEMRLALERAGLQEASGSAPASAPSSASDQPGSRRSSASQLGRPSPRADGAPSSVSGESSSRAGARNGGSRRSSPAHQAGENISALGGRRGDTVAGPSTAPGRLADTMRPETADVARRSSAVSAPTPTSPGVPPGRSRSSASGRRPTNRRPPAPPNRIDQMMRDLTEAGLVEEDGDSPTAGPTDEPSWRPGESARRPERSPSAIADRGWRDAIDASRGTTEPGRSSPRPSEARSHPQRGSSTSAPDDRPPHRGSPPTRSSSAVEAGGPDILRRVDAPRLAARPHIPSSLPAGDDVSAASVRGVRPRRPSPRAAEGASSARDPRPSGPEGAGGGPATVASGVSADGRSTVAVSERPIAVPAPLARGARWSADDVGDLGDASPAERRTASLPISPLPTLPRPDDIVALRRRVSLPRALSVAHRPPSQLPSPQPTALSPQRPGAALDPDAVSSGDRRHSRNPRNTSDPRRRAGRGATARRDAPPGPPSVTSDSAPTESSHDRTNIARGRPRVAASAAAGQLPPIVAVPISIRRTSVVASLPSEGADIERSVRGRQIPEASLRSVDHLVRRPHERSATPGDESDPVGAESIGRLPVPPSSDVASVARPAVSSPDRARSARASQRTGSADVARRRIDAADVAATSSGAQVLDASADDRISRWERPVELPPASSISNDRAAVHDEVRPVVRPPASSMPNDRAVDDAVRRAHQSGSTDHAGADARVEQARRAHSRDRVDRADRTDRIDAADRGDRVQRTQRSDRPEPPDRAHRVDGADPGQRAASSGGVEPAGAAADRGERAHVADRAETLRRAGESANVAMDVPVSDLDGPRLPATPARRSSPDSRLPYRASPERTSAHRGSPDRASRDRTSPTAGGGPWGQTHAADARPIRVAVDERSSSERARRTRPVRSIVRPGTGALQRVLDRRVAARVDDVADLRTPSTRRRVPATRAGGDLTADTLRRSTDLARPAVDERLDDPGRPVRAGTRSERRVPEQPSRWATTPAQSAPPHASSSGAASPGGAVSDAASHAPAGGEDLSERFMSALSETVRRRPRPLPTAFVPLADTIAGPQRVMLSTDTASRAALRSVGKVAATVDDTIHLDRAAVPAAALASVVAHELTHVAHPSPVARFFDDDVDSPEERRAEQVAKIMAASPLAPSASTTFAGVQRSPARPASSSSASAAITALARTSGRSTGGIVQRSPSSSGGSSGTIAADQLAARLTGSAPPAPPRPATPRAAPTPSRSPSGSAVQRRVAPSHMNAPSIVAQAGSGEDEGQSEEWFVEQLDRQIDRIIRKVEERMIREFERRGGRHWGAL